ncbi:MAG: hypothetical protein M1825_000104 [Sarcosagium campestre]|nr:MAG: hypothetical protein M1825_000104 [Sarcosagium campestre]
MPNLADYSIAQRAQSIRGPGMAPFGQRASTAWTPQEDQILMGARAKGLNWAPIQQAHFSTKTPNACRKRHERLMERRNAEDWDAEKFQSLAKEYQNMRKDMWTMLGNRVGEKWQLVEAKVSIPGKSDSPLSYTTRFSLRTFIYAARYGLSRPTNDLKQCMEKGLKNLQSAGRSANRRERLACGMDDSGIGECDTEISASGASDTRNSHDTSDGEKSCIVEHPRPRVEHIRGGHGFETILR